MEMVIVVTWVDAVRTEQWHPHTQELEALDLSPSMSVGHLLRETAEWVAIAQTYHQGGWYRDIITIPIASITSRKVLVEKKSE